MDPEEQQLIDVINRTGYIENLLNQVIEKYCIPPEDRRMFFWDVVLDSAIMPIGSKAKVAMAVAQKFDFKLDQDAVHKVMALRNAFAHHQTSSHPVWVVGKTENEGSAHFELQVISNSGRVSRKKRQDAYAESSTNRFDRRRSRSSTFSPSSRMAVLPPNSALVSDACAAALRAFFSAAQRGR